VVGWYRYGADVYRGFLFDGTSYTTIDDTEAVTTYAKDINNDGVIVGSGWESAGYPHAFIREADGTFSTYFVFGYPADANGINDLGQIVGDYGPSPDELYGYVLSGGIGATPEMLEVPGGTDTIALDINNLGQVVGRYLNASSLGRGFLATPIPEVAGDYNRNGVVDAADYTVWRDTLGRSVARYTGADGNGDGYVDNWDYGAWKDNFGATANSGLGATQSAGADAGVPEPASLALILAATTMLWSRRPSKRRS
jgi:probable HAF family extracellular repeat protein